MNFPNFNRTTHTDQGESYVRRHAKAPSAGSTLRQATGLRRFVRGALATRDASGNAKGIGAPSHGLRLSILGLALAAFFLVPAAQASAETIVTLAGTGTGSVTSSPEGIECSNVGGGSSGPSCSYPFSYAEPFSAELTATPGPGSLFAGWTSEDPFEVGTCHGATNPCGFLDLGEFEFPPENITATFEPLPDPPVVTTGGTSPGANEDLLTLEGTVNPGGAAVGDCHFEYGPTTEYGTSAPCSPDAEELGAGTEAEEVSAEAELEQLKPNATYHYRVVASNAGGAGEGEDRTFTTGPPPSDGCPNHAIRDIQQFGVIALPGCMALEMVSPSHKAGQAAAFPAISANGNRVLFASGAALGEATGVYSTESDPYIATREEGSGWTTTPTSPPAGYIVGWDPLPAQSFTPDFSRWLDIVSTQPQFAAGVDRAFQAGLGGAFAPLSPLLDPLAFYKAEVQEVVLRTEFQGASADHSHLYFVPGPRNLADAARTAYLPGDPEPGPSATGSAADHNTYVALDSAGRPSLELLARDRLGKLWGGTCGAHLGGIAVGTVPLHENGSRNQGAVSADGSRVYFSTRPGQSNSGDCDPAANKLRILVRRETGQGIQIEQLFGSECSRPALPDPPGPCKDLSGDDNYQGASADGTRVYFTTNRQLTGSDGDGSNAECSSTTAAAGCDLYLYDSTLPPGERLAQVSAGEDNTHHEAGEEADVYNGITAISGDGSHAYFVAAGVLTEHPNPAGETAEEGEPNLYLWDAETEAISFIGALAAGDGPPADEVNPLWGSKGGNWRNGAYSAPVQGDGHALLFQSNASLTSNDADGGRRDVFRYDAAADPPTLECVSCLGAADSEPFDISAWGTRSQKPVGTDFAEERRWVSDDGESVLLKTAEPLVPGDVNGARDSYLWRDGHFYRLPGTVDRSGFLLDEPVLSGDGSEIAFQSFSQLLPSDGDSAVNVYAARTGGGFAESEPPMPCNPLKEGSCRHSEPEPATPSAASQAATAGNVKSKPAGCPKGKRRVRRHGEVRCVNERKRHHRRHHKRSTHHDRRAAK